ncbi:hypothetical protein OsI_27789 [Oryza sativa Indica Group]|uniref:Uncharacterized protein n=3 Tax=Oryza TaxID=4527 RepID=A3BPL6_ORYSJ|nr:hypothetical protein OsI_27789 [Oryza sativa Indica Group]EAZ41505.1 hypothetical protein OsJ_26029 [Oryza sativa Japonica Group]
MYMKGVGIKLDPSSSNHFFPFPFPSLPDPRLSPQHFPFQIHELSGRQEETETTIAELAGGASASLPPWASGDARQLFSNGKYDDGNSIHGLIREGGIPFPERDGSTTTEAASSTRISDAAAKGACSGGSRLGTASCGRRLR